MFHIKLNKADGTSLTMLETLTMQDAAEAAFCIFQERENVIADRAKSVSVHDGLHSKLIIFFNK